MTNRTPDPRARQLAEAVHRLAREKATKLPAWQNLPISEREKATTEARLWLRAAVEAGIAPPAECPTDAPDGTLRDRVAAALYESCMTEPAAVAPMTDAVLRALSAIELAVEPEPPLSPDYEHPACGFHWHGRDGMDVPIRDGEPVCPRCELRKVEKQLRHSDKRREELRVESKRRGRNVLELSEKNRALERQIDSIRGQLGAEILRAGQAEATLDRVRRLANRLAAHAAGFQDVLDESDRGPWGKTVGADIAELSAAVAPKTASEATSAPLCPVQPSSVSESAQSPTGASEGLLEDLPSTEDLASADNPTHLRWGLNDVLWSDDDSVIVLLSGPDREAYWLELDPERAAVLREDLAGPAEDAAPDDEFTGTQPCGHDDYHSGHPWADRPDVWCAGH